MQLKNSEKQVLAKISELLILLATYLTPLLFFTASHDQFELPKLTFLTVVGCILIVVQYLLYHSSRWSKIHLFIAFFFISQLIASLPGISLSWLTSFLGDYENFSGLCSILVYILWFWVLTTSLSIKTIEKIFYFNSVAAVISSIYAIAQHFGFDFIQWNQNSVIYNREFAALGNPNFLAAYLAMSIPLLIYLCGKNALHPPVQTRTFIQIITAAFLFSLGIFLLFSATYHGAHLLNFSLNTSSQYQLLAVITGFAFLSISFLYWGPWNSWWATPLLLFILIIGLFSTGSRGGFLGAICGLLVILLFYWFHKSFRHAFRQWLSQFYQIKGIIVGIVILLPFLIFGRFLMSRVMNTILHFKTSLEISRLNIWRPALRMIQVHPWLGVGLDTFKIAFPRYCTTNFSKIDGIFVSSRMAHNELLQIASTTGLLGLIAYLLLLGTALTLAIRIFKNSTVQVQWIVAIVLAAGTAYQVQNLFSFGVASLHFLWYLFLAIIAVLSFPLPLSTQSLKSFSPLMLIVLIVLALGLSSISLRRISADIAFENGIGPLELLRVESNKLAHQKALFYAKYGISHMKQAVHLCPIDVKYRLYLALGYEEQAALISQSPTHVIEILKVALKNYQKTIQISPANAYYYNNLGRVDESLSKFHQKYIDAAIRNYQQATNLAPSNPFFLTNLAIVLSENHELKKSQSTLKRAFQLDAQFVTNYFSQRIIAEYQAGKYALAFHNINLGIETDPNNAKFYYYRGYFYLLLKHFKKSYYNFFKAFHLNPKLPDINKLLKQTHLSMG
jgi:O-antigen ligase/Tfp pilus assembly protein PilF